MTSRQRNLLLQLVQETKTIPTARADGTLPSLRIMSRHGWVVLVDTTYHITKAGLLLLKVEK